MVLITSLVVLGACQTGTPTPAQEQNSQPAAFIQASDPAAQTAPIQVGNTVNQSITLQNPPAEGLTSAEFICSYDPALAEISALTNANQFGTDALAAINGPADGQFIYAIASIAQKATTGGKTFSFDLKALKSGTFNLDCKVRASTGGALFDIVFSPAVITIID